MKSEQEVRKQLEECECVTEMDVLKWVLDED
jgi:hypothetical protein